MVWITTLLMLGLISCSSPRNPEKAIFPTQTSLPFSQPESLNLGLNQREIDTLLSLQQVNDYPLYVMDYSANYRDLIAFHFIDQLAEKPSTVKPWGCSLYASFKDDENMLYGRNFDWGYSPALLLYTDPPFGFASASMVDISYLGYRQDNVMGLDQANLEDRLALLASPSIPFDGINEKGLVVAMAAIPGSNPIRDNTKPTLDSLGIIRVLLDHASNVAEAVAFFQSHNIHFGVGPSLHYLIADASGQAALVEYYHSEVYITYNQNPWHLATNFIIETIAGSPEGYCNRYDTLHERLLNSQGMLSSEEAFQLLEDVSAENTQWSILYNFSDGDIKVVMGRDYDSKEEFQLVSLDHP